MSEEQPGQIAFIRATPEEDRIKKYVLDQMESMGLLMREIQENMMQDVGRWDTIHKFKSILLEIYFYYARAKIDYICSDINSQEKTNEYEWLKGLDYYIKNPKELSLEDSFDYAMVLRNFLEDAGIFAIEKAARKN